MFSQHSEIDVDRYNGYSHLTDKRIEAQKSYVVRERNLVRISFLEENACTLTSRVIYVSYCFGESLVNVPNSMKLQFPSGLKLTTT